MKGLVHYLATNVSEITQGMFKKSQPTKTNWVLVYYVSIKFTILSSQNIFNQVVCILGQ